MYLIDEILAELEQHPDGLTVFQLADTFEGTAGTGDIEAQLAHLHTRGKAVHTPGGVWVWKATSHGGKREGAGRKLQPRADRKSISVVLAPEVLAALDTHHQSTGGTYSATAEHFLRIGLGL